MLFNEFFSSPSACPCAEHTQWTALTEFLTIQRNKQSLLFLRERTDISRFWIRRMVLVHFVRIHTRWQIDIVLVWLLYNFKWISIFFFDAHLRENANFFFLLSQVFWQIRLVYCTLWWHLWSVVKCGVHVRLLYNALFFFFEHKTWQTWWSGLYIIPTAPSVQSMIFMHIPFSSRLHFICFHLMCCYFYSSLYFISVINYAKTGQEKEYCILYTSTWAKVDIWYVAVVTKKNIR